jgi:basic membrane protein A
MLQASKAGYNMIFAVGFLNYNALNSVAPRFPKLKYAGIDQDYALFKSKPPNATGVIFAEHEAGYLVGYLAALEMKKEGHDTISAVGANNVPAIVRYISGYIQGAKKAYPAIKVIASYANDPTFNDQAKCHETALNQINQGSHVVFQVAGGCGLGALQAAKEHHVWGIGVDADQRYLGAHIMTSALKKVDKAVEDLTTLAKQGELKTGGNYTFSLKNGGVGLGSVSPKIPKAFITQTNAIGKQIGDGKIVVKPTIKF